jgi:hypothetical protein
MDDVVVPTGFAVIEDFVPACVCTAWLRDVDDYRRATAVPLIERRSHGRDLRYQVIDGERMAAAFPAIAGLLAEIDDAVAEVCAGDLVRLSGQAGVNVNITPPGGSYRWHYDRCPVTAMIYLNAVAGGELDLYPGYRLQFGRRVDTAVQRYVDAVAASAPARWLARRRHVTLAPAAGRLLVMQGDHCLHSVRSVGDGPDRINLVVSYTHPGAEEAAPELDTYLYSATPFRRSDPNYRRRRHLPDRSRRTVA